MNKIYNNILKHIENLYTISEACEIEGINRNVFYKSISFKQKRELAEKRILAGFYRNKNYLEFKENNRFIKKYNKSELPFAVGTLKI